MKEILRTDRLVLREMCEDDLAALTEILGDEKTMYAYEHAFSASEIRAWLDNQYRRYREDGFGLWGAERKENGQLIGQCGLTKQPVNGMFVTEIGYLFERAVWHRGYSTEAAAACKEYAFGTLKIPAVYSIIRNNNLPSQRVALRNGMQPCGEIVKHYHGIDMPHILFRAINPDRAFSDER